MRRLAIGLLLAAALASCGGRDAARGTPASYAAATDRLCSDLVAAITVAFSDAPAHPRTALHRYARAVADAGRRFSAVSPPPGLGRFGAAASAHVAGEAARLRGAARRSDTRAVSQALGAHQRLLPPRIPAALLRLAPSCGGPTLAAPPAVQPA